MYSEAVARPGTITSQKMAAGRNQPLTPPIMTPVTKYFWTNG